MQTNKNGWHLRNSPVLAAKSNPLNGPSIAETWVCLVWQASKHLVPQGNETSISTLRIQLHNSPEKITLHKPYETGVASWLTVECTETAAVWYSPAAAVFDL